MSELKLDFTLDKAEDRIALVKQILDETPKSQQTQRYIEYLSDYIIQAVAKEEKKSKKILTDNRLVTINKRETSYEGLVGKLENGEDGIYNMMTSERNQFLTPKIAITEEDLAEIPELRKIKETITKLEALEKKATGRKKYLLKKHLIELHQEQYTIKNDFKKPIYAQHTCKTPFHIDVREEVHIGADGQVSATGLLSLMNPAHVSQLLCNYSELKEDNYDNFSDDMYYLMQDLDDLIDRALKDTYPLYYDLMICKIDGMQNIDIQRELEEKHGIKHSVEYISCLWRNKIPKVIAEKAQEEYLIWYYTNVEKGKWKRCSRCGQVKLANNRFFSKNNTSKDGLYSICKECRNKKNVLKKES